MPKNDLESIKKAATHQELINLRLNLMAVKDQVNQNLDGILERINRLLPPDDGARSLKYKNFSKKDWHEYMKS